MDIISVIIPVYNGESTLERCILSLKNQSGFDTIQIVVLDSESTDQSQDIALNLGCEVFTVEKKSFNHGLTRNFGVLKAKSDLLFFTVQDAFFQDDDALFKMAQHFKKNEVMGVVGHQAVPHHPDKNPILWYFPQSKSKITKRKLPSGIDFDDLSQVEKEKLINWDNVVSMYRKSALIELPFEKTFFAEDWLWSKAAIVKGWTTVYDPSIVIYHYHHLSYEYTYKTNFTVYFHFYKHFGFVPKKLDLIKPSLKAVYRLLKSNSLNFSRKIYWIRYNLINRYAKFKVNRDFLRLLMSKNIVELENIHNKICVSIPQGSQNNKISKTTNEA
ncbi:MAG: glycosyltransferase [Bacteroidetes bacterium]|nr:glycosyltransferase [Bacteroidota bacterium]